MIIKVQCPDCQKVFSIELVKMSREIDRLKLENARLRKEVKDKEALSMFNDWFGGLK